MATTDRAPQYRPHVTGRQHLTLEECVARYPRLTRAMQYVAILSSGEAGAALRDYRDGYSDYAGGEAVMHFGGVLTVLACAIKSRHRVPSYHRMPVHPLDLTQ